MHFIIKKLTSIPVVIFIVLITLNSCSQNSPELNTWKQDKFVISTFHAVGPNTTKYATALQLHKDAGFDLVELTFLSSNSLDAAISSAEQIGIKIIAQDKTVMGGFQNEFPTIDESAVANRVHNLKNKKMIEGYYVWDEPLMQNLSQVRRLRDLIKKNDPNRLAFSCMLPSYGYYSWTDGSYKRYVDAYLSTINPEIVSFDYYPFKKATDSLTMNTMWQDMGYIRKKALELKKPFWFYFQACAITPATDIPIDIPRMKAQIYASMAYGVKGLSYYMTSPGGALLDGAYQKTTLYNDIKNLNSEVKALGNFLYNKSSEKIYQTSIGVGGERKYFLDYINESTLLKSAPKNLVLGVFGDGSAKKYILITNLKHNNAVQGIVTLQKSMNITLYDKKTGVETTLDAASDSFNINLTAGEAALFILQ